MIHVEDGSRSDPKANSYAERQTLIDFGARLGVSVTDDESADVALIKAAQFIDTHEPNLRGERIARDQPMAFPRAWLEIDGWLYEPDLIPEKVKQVQLDLALDILEGTDPWNPPVNPERAVKSERVEGAVSQEYFGKEGAVRAYRMTTWQAKMRSLLRGSFGSIALVRA